MAIYLGSNQVKLNLSQSIWKIVNIKGVAIISSDNYVLKDSQGLYITTEEEK